MFRCACMIDGGYLCKIQEQHGNIKINHNLFARKMANEVDILRTYFYHCPPYVSARPTPEESTAQRRFDSFTSALQNLPHFECRFGRLEKRTDATGHVYYEQKRVDVMLATDIATLGAKKLVSHINLMAGDSDLIPAIKIAKSEGVIINLFHGPLSTVHKDLLLEVDNRIFVNKEFLEDCAPR